MGQNFEVIKIHIFGTLSLLKIKDLKSDKAPNWNLVGTAIAMPKLKIVGHLISFYFDKKIIKIFLTNNNFRRLKNNIIFNNFQIKKFS